MMIKIYKITLDDGRAYVGQTKVSVAQRISHHRTQPVNTELKNALDNEIGHTVEILSSHRKQVIADFQEMVEINKIPDDKRINKVVKKGHIPKTGNPPLRKNRGLFHYKKKNNDRREGVYACSVCRESKPSGEFHSDRTRYNGLMSKCKSCALSLRRVAHVAKKNGSDVSVAWQAEKARLRESLAEQ